jgi:hypothetical protein
VKCIVNIVQDKAKRCKSNVLRMPNYVARRGPRQEKNRTRPAWFCAKDGKDRAQVFLACSLIFWLGGLSFFLFFGGFILWWDWIMAVYAPLYDYLVVIDFEATCDEGENPQVTRANQEIIEFPW